MSFTRITIIRTETTDYNNLNDQLKWFGASLGLFNLRDKDGSCFRIFIVLLKDLKSLNKGLSSDEIAAKTLLSRGTVVHHLNKLMDSGFVVSVDNRYFLKANSMEELVDDVEKNILKSLKSLREVGKDLDKNLGLK
ncbi:MAG: ArsR family transcriptional regulator [Candidatus Woesearchaeota archaeon]